MLEGDDVWLIELKPMEWFAITFNSGVVHVRLDSVEKCQMKTILLAALAVMLIVQFFLIFAEEIRLGLIIRVPDIERHKTRK